MRSLRLLFALSLFAPLAVSAQQAHVQTAINHIQQHAHANGISSADVAELVVTDAYLSRRSGVTHIYVRQSINGIEVIGTEITVSIDASGRVLHMAGIDRLVGTGVEIASPEISAAASADALARHNRLTPTTSFRVLENKAGVDRRVMLSAGGVSLEPIRTRLVWHENENRTLRLAWEVGIYETNAQHYWHGYVDAQTGVVLAQSDLVVSDTFGPANADMASPSFAPIKDANLNPMMSAMVGSYKVYPMPIEAPIYAPVLPPTDGRTIVANPDDVTASPFGWHDTNGVSGAEFTTTQGNNVHAYTDLDANNSPDAGSSPNGGGSLVFNFPLDLNQPPSAYRPAAVTNLFYWNNVIHDVLYHHGFDETSGNFQVNNYGNGGLGNDDVRAEAQDGSGTNNANFFTPADGSRPRMQMFVGTSPNPDVDGDFDNGVIVHEFGHGISNRLTGGPSAASCLANSEQMGEGWGDIYAMMMTMKAGDSRNDSRGMGNYLFGYGANGGGIRLAPYSTNFGVNSYTYGDTKPMRAVHQVGFVWATILWEVMWDMVDAYGFDPDLYNAAGTAGNQIVFRLVTEGMKYQPCSPGFVSGRDGILAAEQAIYGGTYASAVQAAFARRGLGYSASEGSTNRNRDNNEAFDLWPGGNASPNASFSYSCTLLSCSFTDTSSDSDGSIVSRAWTFGDGGASTVTNPSHAYGASGTYIVSLTVTDNGGATDAASQNVTVSTTGGNPIVLSVTTRTQGPWTYADLVWTESDGGLMNVFVNGGSVTQTTDDGSYSYRVGRSPSGSFSYQVCDNEDSACSNVVNVSYLVGNGHPASALGVPVETTVLGAYPNPFNPSSTIRYALAERGQVELAVHNTLGQRVALLVSGVEETGLHEVLFDASSLPSGIYVYTLRTMGQLHTGRLMLVK